MQITKDSLVELEFDKILEMLQEFAFSEVVKEKIMDLEPLENDDAKFQLQVTDEYVRSFESANIIPFAKYEDIISELRYLEIENYCLEAHSFLKIRNINTIVNQVILFLEKFQEYFPTIYQFLQKVPFNKEIITTINAVFNRFGEIKNDASPALLFIRTDINNCRMAIQKNFDKALQSLAQTGVLDDIRETVIDDQRVLAVKSAMKKRIKGRILGMSKTGSITYIQPDSVVKFQFQLQENIEEEKKEIRKILMVLTQKMSENIALLDLYQDCIFELNFWQAKAKLALRIGGKLPKINDHKYSNFVQAFHPLLLISNTKDGLKTFPQNIILSEKNRILCISGPNAGGKSITLKTIGLLQIMVQSGLLIPVKEGSEVFFYDKILTDIGDNQSIENHLSTYSSRLKKMARIIREADDNSLLLIDEFGTGSDPDLGGALAEAFLDFFYGKDSFAIITTHYNNIKLKIEELPFATNAAMLFDEYSLLPMYKLEIGQAGSSFTFEVAEKNRIPRFIIRQAKMKIEQGKVNLDKTIVKLQQEKYEIEKQREEFGKLIEDTAEKKDAISETEKRIKDKLGDFNKLYNDEQRKLSLGEKYSKFIEEYTNGKSKRDIIKDFTKVLEMEKYKYSQDNAPKITEELKNQKKIKEIIQKELKKEEVQQEIKEVKLEIAKEKKQQLTAVLKVGNKARIKGSSAVGIIEKIDKEKVTLNYGQFTTKISIFEIEKV